MALTINYDSDLLNEWRDNNERQLQAIKELSDNIGKWQGELTSVIQQGFSDLTRTLGGTGDEQLQVLIDQIATNLNLSTDEVEAAIKTVPTKKGGE